MSTLTKRWDVAVVIASGPSLTKADCDLVREWRQKSPKHGVIVTNTSFLIAPWADVLYAHDIRWWRQYHEMVCEVFQGERWSRNVTKYGTTRLRHPRVPRGGNSGADAISVAVIYGAEKVILLGVDCQPDAKGRNHWHGAHPPSLGDCASMPKFPRHFQKVAEAYPYVDIVNCSRETALTVFRQARLEDELYS